MFKSKPFQNNSSFSSIKKDISNPFVSKVCKDPSFSLLGGGYPSFPKEMMNSNKFGQCVDRIKSNSDEIGRKDEDLTTDKKMVGSQKESYQTSKP